MRTGIQPAIRISRPRSACPARFTIGAPVAVAVVIALAACGTSVRQHQAHYVSGLRAIDTSLTASVRRLLSTVTPTTARSTTAGAVGRFEVQLAAAETRLRTLHAPASVARRHRHLVRAIDRYATGLQVEVQALRSGSARKLSLSGQRMLIATRRLSADVRGTVFSIEQVLAASGAPGG